MHDHDNEELILDLLDDPMLRDEDIAARLEHCPDCVADVTDQRAVTDLLASMETAPLTAGERQLIGAGVASSLDADVVVPLRSSRRIDWMRIGTVAAALFGVVAVAGLIATIGDQTASQDDAGITAAFETTEEAAGGADGDTAAAADSALNRPEVDSERATAENAGTTSLAPPSELIVDLGRVDRATFLDELEAIRTQANDMGESSGVLESSLAKSSVSCISSLDDPGMIRAVLVAIVDDAPVEVYIDVADEAAAFESADCSRYELP